MRSLKVSADEQYRLVMECRASGLSDYQWCLEHGIKPGTFYNWVKRLRQKGCSDIPAAAGRGSYKEMPKQEVVRIDFQPIAATTGEPELPDFHSELPPVIWSPSIELTLGQANIRITNDADPELLAQTIRILKEFSC